MQFFCVMQKVLVTDTDAKALPTAAVGHNLINDFWVSH